MGAATSLYILRFTNMNVIILVYLCLRIHIFVKQIYCIYRFIEKFSRERKGKEKCMKNREANNMM